MGNNYALRERIIFRIKNHQVVKAGSQALCVEAKGAFASAQSSDARINRSAGHAVNSGRYIVAILHVDVEVQQVAGRVRIYCYIANSGRDVSNIGRGYARHIAGLIYFLVGTLNPGYYFKVVEVFYRVFRSIINVASHLSISREAIGTGESEGERHRIRSAHGTYGYRGTSICRHHLLHYIVEFRLAIGLYVLHSLCFRNGNIKFSAGREMQSPMENISP